MEVILINIFICILIADFITGFFHWVEDTYGTVDNSWLSKNFWEPNIFHHKYPSKIAENNFWDRNYLQWLMAAISIFFIYLFNFLSWEIALTIIIASFGNEIHVWNHRKKNNFLIELLQDMCIVQTKLHHAKHHLSPYSTRYCVITNLLNPILEIIYFWRFLELLLYKIIKPQRGSDSRDGY